MQEVLGSNPQNDIMEITSAMSHNVSGWSFFRPILQYEYLAINEVQKLFWNQNTWLTWLVITD